VLNWKISVKSAYNNDDDDDGDNNNNNDVSNFHYPISVKGTLPLSLYIFICACVHLVFQEHAICSRLSTWSREDSLSSVGCHANYNSNNHNAN